MEAKVSRGFLQVHDEKGSYRIPIGRRGRRCLIVLDKKEGEYVRSLELDLFTGFVYYCVDNETSGGLSYYYDMSSKKVGHYFIHRYLRLAAVRGFGASAKEREVFEKLPCDNWVEEMEKLPGWKETIEHRIDSLLLPEGEPVCIPMAGSDIKWSGEGVDAVVFSRHPSAYPSQAGKYVFQFVKKGDGFVLQHLDENVGREFFGQNEEYELVLSAEEYAWIQGLIEGLFGEGKKADAACANAAVHPHGELLRDGAGMVTKEVEIRSAGAGSGQGEVPAGSRHVEITEGDAEAQEAAAVLYNVLRGLLRREIRLV